MKVLILGGYGVFGGRLARLLIGRGHDVCVAGRSAGRAASFVAECGGAAMVLDRDAPGLARALEDVRPDVVVDASGPFQGQASGGYPVARAALIAGAHYLDLADDAAFAGGITTLDADARRAGRMAVSGASSVPALSSAVIADLVQGIDVIGVIETAICPGNRAPRGRSVMAAILAQVGAPVRMWRGGQGRDVRGWSDSRRLVIADDMIRRVAFIGAPDPVLFPKVFAARSVLFRAGLELGVMHRALAVLSWLRWRGWMPPPGRFVVPLQWLADRMQRMGSDRGGMVVRVAGRIGDAPVERRWRCVAPGGVGPFIPALPALVLIDAIAAGRAPPGARPAVSVFDLATVETALRAIGVAPDRCETGAPRLFEAALGGRWAKMPPVWRRVHDLWDHEVLQGSAQVTRGTSLAARVLCAIFRFPAAAATVPVTVTMTRTPDRETWLRDFGGRRFQSTLAAAGAGHLIERFGVFRFLLELTGDQTHLGMQVRAGWVLGVPLPRRMLPRSDAREYVSGGRFHFDVGLSLPGAGLLVRYRGWLEPESDATGA